MEAQRGLRGFNIYHPETGEVERVELDGLRPFIVVKTTQERAPSDLRELLERVKSCSQRPVVVVIYSFKELPIEKFSELLAQIEKFSLYLKVVKRPVLEEAAEEGEVRGKSFHQLFEEFAKELGLSERVKKLSWEVVAAPPERVEEVVESFLKRELGELHSILEKWGE
jgi:ribosomal protein L10